MTIGKRKGVAAKGAGAQPGEAGLNNRTGGSLSKNDHNYLTRSYGLTADPGIGGAQFHDVSGGVINEYTEPGPGNVYRSHTFTSSGVLTVNTMSAALPSSLDVLVVAGGGAGGHGDPGAYETGGGGAGGFRTCLLCHLVLVVIQ